MTGGDTHHYTTEDDVFSQHNRTCQYLGDTTKYSNQLIYDEHKEAFVAQSVKCLSVNLQVGGSSPLVGIFFNM